MTLVVNLLPVSTILVANLPPISKILAVNFPTSVPQISSANRKSRNLQICGLTKFVTFVDLTKVWQFANLQFFGPNILFAICGLNSLSDLKLEQICKFFYFSPYKCISKMFKFEFLFYIKFRQINLQPTFR
jgi:hypothetical protein